MDERYAYLPANCIIQQPQSIVVNQVVGEQDVQKVIDICLVVPRHKPAIEQVVDVFVKKLCITEVNLLPHKVVVRGSFEVKALYVACLPSQPVHAVEARHIRFTAAGHIPGCHYGMDADAHAMVEYVDYSVRRRPFRRLRTAAKKPKWKKIQPHQHSEKYDYHHDYDYDHHGHDDCHDDGCKHHNHDCDHHDYDCKHHDHDCHHHEHDCDHHDHDCGHHDHDCKPHYKPKPKPKHCKPCCYYEIDVSVIIRIHIKVMTDRKILLYAGSGGIGQLPHKPKG